VQQVLDGQSGQFSAAHHVSPQMLPFVDGVRHISAIAAAANLNLKVRSRNCFYLKIFDKLFDE
jgi:hypothetical protein